jgi:hypothetical protein
MNLGGAEMSAIRMRLQSGRFPAKADIRWQESSAGSVANGPIADVGHSAKDEGALASTRFCNGNSD